MCGECPRETTLERNHEFGARTRLVDRGFRGRTTVRGKSDELATHPALSVTGSRMGRVFPTGLTDRGLHDFVWGERAGNGLRVRFAVACVVRRSISRLLRNSILLLQCRV